MADHWEDPLIELAQLRELCQSKAAKLSELVKLHEVGQATTQDVQSAAREAAALNERFSAQLVEIQAMAGFPEEAASEYVNRPGAVEYPARLLRTEIEEAPSTLQLEESVQNGLENLLALVSNDWLEAEAQKCYRLDPQFRSEPFHLVAGTLAGHQLELPRPHYFARMLLVAGDFLAGNPEFDYWVAPTLLTEVAVLGNSLAELKESGAEAQRKLLSLSSIESKEVPPLIYELLVAAAFVRHGVETEMVEAHPGTKSPDIRLLNQGVPTSVECKRRLGLTTYEVQEAKHVQHLYKAGRGLLQAGDAAHSVECTFRCEVLDVTDTMFLHALREVMGSPEGTARDMGWGTLVHRLQPAFLDVVPGLLYSPSYLQRVFSWQPLEPDWDGLLCEVEPPQETVVENARSPISLKWASVSDTAMTKKSRDVTSLWGKATGQIPAGEFGFIYIAYPEGARPAIADNRTKSIERATSHWYNRWHVNIPFTVINRLYGRPLTDGRPDFIENSILLLRPGFEEPSLSYPAGIFAPER